MIFNKLLPLSAGLLLTLSMPLESKLFSSDTPSINEEQMKNNEMLDHFSQGFVNVAKHCREAVVHIRVETGPSSYKGHKDLKDPSSQLNPFEQFQEQLFNQFFGSQGHRSRETPPQISNGSGFIVDPAGYIITNYHVIKDGNTIIVERYGKIEQEYIAELVGYDPHSDLAVLKIEAEDLPSLEFGDSDQIEVGQWTVAIGHPFKLRHSVTAGVISATHRGDLQISKLEDFIQTDTAINPGNSGGPLLSLRGKVIGVNTAILSKGGGSIGVGFAVPSNICKIIYEQIKEKGSFDRAFLGVQIQDLSDDLKEGFKIDKNISGAIITDVVKNSPAAHAGILPGDVVISFNKMPINGATHLQTQVAKLPSGESCNLQIIRDGKEKKITITLGSQNKGVISSSGNVLDKLGISVDEVRADNANKYGLRSTEKGVVITEILPNSTAARLGWKEGSLILVINGTKIESVEHLKELIESSEKDGRLVVLMNHQGRATFQSIPHPYAEKK